MPKKIYEKFKKATISRNKRGDAEYEHRGRNYFVETEELFVPVWNAKEAKTLAHLIAEEVVDETK